METLYYLEHPFLIVASFFDSIIRRFNNSPKRLNALIVFLANMMFNIIFSIMFGGILSIFIFAYLTVSSKILPDTTTLLIVPMFLFTVLSCIVLLNGRNQNFSLPWCIFIFYGIFISIRPKKQFIQTLAFLFIVMLILAFILFLFVSTIFHPSDNQVSSLVFVTTAIAFVLTVFLYSYGTLDDLTRVRRQFLLWFTILLGVLFFSAYQLKINLNEPLSDQIHIGSALLILTFIYSMITVVDKCIELFKLSLAQYEYILVRTWDDYSSKYDSGVIWNKINKSKDVISLKIEWAKLFWRMGAVSTLVYIVLVDLLYIFFISGLCYFLIFSNWVSKIFSLCKNVALENLTLSEEQVEFFLMLFASITFFIWNLISLCHFKKSNWTIRSQLLGRLFVSIIIFLTILDQTDFGKKYETSQILYYVLIVFGIWILVVFITNKVHRIIMWIKNKGRSD